LGTSISPNNVLRRHVFPECTRLGLHLVTWLIPTHVLVVKRTGFVRELVM